MSEILALLPGLSLAKRRMTAITTPNTTTTPATMTGITQRGVVLGEVYLVLPVGATVVGVAWLVQLTEKVISPESTPTTRVYLY